MVETKRDGRHPVLQIKEVKHIATRVFAKNVREPCCSGPDGNGCPYYGGRGKQGNYLIIDAGGRDDRASVQDALFRAWNSRRCKSEGLYCSGCGKKAILALGPAGRRQFLFGWYDAGAKEGTSFAVTDEVIAKAVKLAEEARLRDGGRQ
jgi:hypothetical protein